MRSKRWATVSRAGSEAEWALEGLMSPCDWTGATHRHLTGRICLVTGHRRVYVWFLQKYFSYKTKGFLEFPQYLASICTWLCFCSPLFCLPFSLNPRFHTSAFRHDGGAPVRFWISLTRGLVLFLRSREASHAKPAGNGVCVYESTSDLLNGYRYESQIFSSN